MTRPVVCNAGPLIHLDQLDSLDLLSDYPAVFVPDAVWDEVTKFRPNALPKPYLEKKTAPASVKQNIDALCKAFSLDSGEGACLSLLAEFGNAIFLTDDAAARLAGEQAGLEVHGTIGVLVRSIRKGKRTPTQVIQLLDEIPIRTTLYIDPAILVRVKETLRQQFGMTP